MPIHPARVVERLWNGNKYAVMARSYEDYSRLRDDLGRGISSPLILRTRLEEALRKPEREISNALSHAYGHLKDYLPEETRSRIRQAIDEDPDLARELIFGEALCAQEEVLLSSRLFYSPSWFDRLWVSFTGTWYFVTCTETGNITCENEDAVRTQLTRGRSGAESALGRVLEPAPRGGGIPVDGKDIWLGEAGALAPWLLVTHIGRKAYANLLPAVTMYRSLRFN